jgi:23S rRNA (adenine2503-C2)-methyltransferase
MSKTKYNIKDLSHEELFAFFEKLHERPFRAKQLNDALYMKRIKHFDDITNFPQALRDKLNDTFTVSSLKWEKEEISQDGSRKFLYKTDDKGLPLETVFLPNIANVGDGGERNTLCISTMSGCPVNCKFCATGRLGYNGALKTSEILDQLLQTANVVMSGINNLVLMGMGEPLLNYDNVVAAIRILSTLHIFNKRDITISTVGIPARIADLTNLELHTKLAVSLHSPMDSVRQELIPLAKSYTLDELLESLEYYYRASHLPVTYEYILFKGVNDSDKDAEKLTRIARRFPSKINLIPYNDISFIDADIGLEPASTEEIAAFAKKLHNENVMVITRKSQGQDISAACGQLAAKEM